MQFKPAYTVIVTTHHRPLLLIRALKSLLAQTDLNFEIILCADESSEETKKIAIELLRPCDSFLILPNLQGPAATRNLAINLAKGKWIYFLDDDDTVECNFFEKISNKLNGQNADIFYFDFCLVEEQRMPDETILLNKKIANLSKYKIDTLEVRNFIPLNSLIINSNAAKINLFDESLRAFEDWDFLIAAKRRLNLKFVYLESICEVNYHVDNGILSRNKMGMRGVNYMVIYIKWPVTDEEIKKKRGVYLEKFKVKIPESMI